MRGRLEVPATSSPESHTRTPGRGLCELWQIDENLIRAELTPAQEAKHLARRKELWKLRKAPKESGKTFPTIPETGRGNKQFATDTTKATRQSQRDINRKVARAEKIAPDVPE